MDLHDHELDSLITLSLRPQPVTSRHKQRAWERLQLKLTEQTQQPALQQAPSFSVQTGRLCRSVWQSLRSFALEESRYHSARQEQYAFRYYSFSSTPVSFAMELIGPLRTSSMGQVC